MTSEQDSLQTDNKQLAQSIINEMQAQGFLNDFIDKETGEALVEIQFSGEKMNFKIDMQGNESFQK